MKILKIMMILLLLTSCSDKKTEKKLTEFDKILGKENSETLHLLVSEFENDFLKRQYPNLDIKSGYEKFVTEISENKIEFVEFSEKSRNLFYESKLRLEIYCVNDSTWIEKNPWNDKTFLVKGRTKCLNPDGTFENGSMEMPFNENEITKDSIKEKYKYFVESNYNGKYLKALNSISSKSEFLKSFYKIRTDFGVIESQLIAEQMLRYKVDFDNYYIKRLVIIELRY
ncbi:hypothetical protein [Lacinutrix sp. Bg11-31]|uniref:hypothetical protein n=1 Tax=Lacinutrix sp. Bg11-31 TaxID=2057808 RepID=UPI000C30E0C9|nr:hypothetical protein [Lacinutrix sp. Bg11-31]AUC80785.1 hypothetical protein CW733_00995 [Lacinutrix sp. Bg11-31]